MATSGSVDYVNTTSDIITEALQLCGVIGEGETASATQITDNSRTLNNMIKAWQSDGMQLWAKKEAVLIPDVSNNTQQYTLSSTGDRAVAVSGFVKTEVETAGVATDSTLEVDSITGMAASDIIGIELDDGTIQWTTINGAPSGTTITLTAALTGATAVDNHVYVYTSTDIINKPLQITYAHTRTSGEVDIPVAIISHSEYRNISTKDEDGRINQIYADYQKDTVQLYVWPTGSDSKELLYFTFQRPFEDMDSSTDDIDFPQEWYLAVVMGLARLLSLKYEVPRFKRTEILRDSIQYKDAAMFFDAEKTSIFLQPGSQSNW